MKKRTVSLLLIGVMITGCASKPEDIAAVAYPDEAYASLSCEEIGLEIACSRRQVSSDLKGGRTKRGAGLVRFFLRQLSL